MRHGSLQMTLNYKSTTFYKICSIDKWNNQIQKYMLKIPTFKFLSDFYFYFIIHININ